MKIFFSIFTVIFISVIHFSCAGEKFGSKNLKKYQFLNDRLKDSQASGMPYSGIADNIKDMDLSSLSDREFSSLMDNITKGSSFNYNKDSIDPILKKSSDKRQEEFVNKLYNNYWQEEIKQPITGRTPGYFILLLNIVKSMDEKNQERFFKRLYIDDKKNARFCDDELIFYVTKEEFSKSCQELSPYFNRFFKKLSKNEQIKVFSSWLAAHFPKNNLERLAYSLKHCPFAFFFSKSNLLHMVLPAIIGENRLNAASFMGYIKDHGIVKAIREKVEKEGTAWNDYLNLRDENNQTVEEILQQCKKYNTNEILFKDQNAIKNLLQG